MATVAFIGLGNMGGPMATNLVKAGHTVTVFDLSEAACRQLQAAGAAVAASAAEAAAGVDYVLSMLPAGKHVAATYLGENGLLAGLDQATTVLDCSTIDAATARQVSGLQLHSGAVSLGVRVPPADADGRTEVGQVGLALNTMLDDVESALTARQESEMRVRQFVADASHELRTPLASIRGYAELTQRETEPVPSTVTHAIGRVESEALRMQGLVEDLLLLARLDSGRPLEREPVDLSLLAMNAVSDAHAASPDHAWELDLPDEPVEVPGDRARLHQILANLLANARTHTPAGTRVVTRLRSEGALVRVSVSDDGPGIPLALQSTVFERFTRGEESRSRAKGSTGLGSRHFRLPAAGIIDSRPRGGSQASRSSSRTGSYAATCATC